MKLSNYWGNKCFFQIERNGFNTITWTEMPHHSLSIEGENIKYLSEIIVVWVSFYIFTSTDYDCELETGVDFFRLSNVTGTFKGFREDSGVFGLPELLAPGSEVLHAASAWPEGTCVCSEDEAVSWLCTTSLYLLVIKFTWLLMSWPTRRRSRSAIKSKITWAPAVKKEGKDSLYWLEFYIWGQGCKHKWVFVQNPVGDGE